MSEGLDPFDLDAAALRRSETELRAFMEALAVRLEAALPNRVKVERRREGLFSKTARVARISLQADRAAYELSLQRGRLLSSRAKLVRGVVLSSAEIELSAWLTEVRQELRALAEQAGAATDVLGDFL